MSDLMRRLPLDAISRPVPIATRLPGAELDDVLDPRRLLRALERRKGLIATVAIAVLAPAGLWTLLTTPLFRSSALVSVSPEPMQVLPYREIDAPDTPSNYEITMNTQEQLLRSDTLLALVAARIRREPGHASLMGELATLRTHLEIYRLPNSQLFRLSYLAPSPDASAAIANMFAEEFIKRHFENRQEMRLKARELLERELETLETRVQASEQELVDYAQSHNIQSLDQGLGDMVQQRLMMLAKQVSDVDLEVAGARAQLDALSGTSIDNFPERYVTPVIAGRIAQRLQLEQELTNLRATYGEAWPAVVQKQKEIALLDDQLAREKLAVLDQARQQATIDFQAVGGKKTQLQTALRGQEQLLNQFQDASIRYNIIRREVETNQKLYEGLLERLKQTSVTPGMELGSIQVVESARVPDEPYSPKVLWNLGLASLLGLALGFCVALLRDYWDSSISSVAELESLAAVVPTLGSVPLMQPLLAGGEPPARRGALGRTVDALTARYSGRLPGVGRREPRRRVAVRQPLDRAPEALESLRNICASILLSQSGRPPRVILITSAVAGEGKSTLVSEIGRTLAETGMSTVLVECDMRQPTLSAAFGVGPQDGLSLFLAGHLPQGPTVHETDHPNLFVVAAGPSAPNPPALLGSEKMSVFLGEMAARYRFVLLDTPPLLPVADTRVLGSMVEGAVLVVRAGRTPKDMMCRAWTMLHGLGTNLLGVVLNGADPRGPDAYLYQHYYESYEREADLLRPGVSHHAN